MIPRKQLFLHILLYTIGLAVVAKFLPFAFFIPVAATLTVGHVVLSHRRKKHRYEKVIESAASTQVDSFPMLEALKRHDADEVLIESFKEVTAELERKCYQLVEKNIQLLSLKEISLTIVSSLTEARIVDAVKGFLSKGLGFKEIFMGIFVPENETFHMYTFRETFGESSLHERPIDLDQLEGLLRKSVATRKPILIKDPEMHPLGGLNGDPMFTDSTMQSYLIVPMIKSTFSQTCWKAEACILRNQSAPPTDTSNLRDSVCMGCGRLPVLGLIGVTDGFKAGSLSQVDLVAVETLALQVSTLLENSQLFTELQKEERFREKVINSMMNGLITVDTKGTILLANEMAERLTGYQSAELEGKNVDDVIIDSVKENGRGPVLRALPSGKATYQKEVWLVKKDGSKLPIRLNTSFLLDENKQIQGALAVFFDLTRIKRMEEKILHLDKLAALGRFSSSMAHEIRNPLTGIVAGLQYLNRVGGIPEGQEENIRFILKEVNRIDRLISDILNVVRVGDLMYEPVRIESLIDSSVTSIGELARERGVSINCQYPARTRTVTIDSDRITQVMINLLKNAVEASDAGSSIRVKVAFPMDSNDVMFEQIQDVVIIEIEDQGVGFTEEEKSKIFEPFFTTKPEGTGLGLYVAYSIIEKHGGYVFVESEKHKGSVFTVYLPVEKVQYGDSSEVSHPIGG